MQVQTSHAHFGKRTMFLKKKPNQQKNVRNIGINITHVKLKTETKQIKNQQCPNKYSLSIHSVYFSEYILLN